MNFAFGKTFDLLLYPFQNVNPWVGMTLVSLLTGLLMLWVYKYTSNQEGIKSVKDKIKAHLLELRLYKDNFQATIQAQKKILGYNARYMFYALKPMLVMLVPIVLILIQLDLWFGYRPLKPGESVLLKVKLDRSPLQTDLTLQPSPGVEIETPPLRVEEGKEIDWRVRGTQYGDHTLTFTVDNQSFTKQLVVSRKPIAKMSRARVQNHLFDRLLAPGESPIPAGLPVTRVELVYPGQEMNLFGWSIHWLISFFILSIVFGFGLKGFFGVEV
ncbi:MAG: hypothetical protein AB1714_17495 [Acidobacteriota bacterium]